MKIALCFSGQPRFAENGYPYYKGNLIDHYDTDTFVHIWNDPDKVGLPYEGGLGQKYDIQSPETPSKILDLYKPKKFLCEPQKKFEIYEKCNTCSKDPSVVYSMFYSRFMANKLKSEYEKENNFKYDVVFYTRFDFALNTKFDFSSLDLSYVYIPDFDTFNDQCGFGSSLVIDMACDIYNKINEYCESGVMLMGEDMLKKQILNVTTKINYNHPFFPDKYGCSRHSLIRPQ
jgi:hypothetical protein